jgi:Uma2 family endonuclease
MTTQATKLITAEELFEMGDVGRVELIRGEIVPMSPAGSEHGRIAAKVLQLIGSFIGTRKLGVVFAAETGFTIERAPDSVRAPDVSFVTTGRYAPTPKYFEGAPDLAVEVMSPPDRWSEVTEKIDGWLGAGCKSCWVVDPKTKSITVYGARQVHRFRTRDVLRDETVLPGFELPVEEVFSL